MDLVPLNVKFRKKRLARFAVVTAVVTLVAFVYIFRLTYVRYVDNQRMITLQDYADQLDQLNESLRLLKTSGNELDEELSAMRSHIVNTTTLP